MWCINLSNLVTGVLWFLVVANFVGAIYLTFAHFNTDYWQAKQRFRIVDSENDIAGLKVDVKYLMKKEKEK